MFEPVLREFMFSFAAATVLTVGMSGLWWLASKTGLLADWFAIPVQLTWRHILLIAVMIGVYGVFLLFGMYHYRGPLAYRLGIAVACGSIGIGLATTTLGWKLQRTDALRAFGASAGGTAAVCGVGIWLSEIARLYGLDL